MYLHIASSLYCPDSTKNFIMLTHLLLLMHTSCTFMSSSVWKTHLCIPWQMCLYASRLVREVSDLTNFDTADYYLELSDHLDCCLLSPLLMRSSSMTNLSRIWSSHWSSQLWFNGIPQFNATINALSTLRVLSPFLLWWHTGVNWRQKPWRVQVKTTASYWKQQGDKKTD